MDLKDLDGLFAKQNCNPKCGECSILGRPGQHGIEDYQEKSDILFLAGSMSNTFGELGHFRHEELNIIEDCVSLIPREVKITYSAAVKCPGIKDSDISVSDRNICRNHVEGTIDTVSPKLVFVCGELAYLMLFKKKGCTKHRGTQLEYMTPNGTKTVVVPLFHPWQVVAEPKNKYLFHLDINNAVNAVVLGKETQGKLEYEYIDTFEELLAVKWPKTGNISIDIETTGLNFLKDIINTIAFSWRQDDRKIKTICIPIQHKDSPFNVLRISDIIEVLKPVFSNRDTKKILQNCKFDLRFLKRYGIEEVYNVWDTKLMQHLIDENVPKNLKALVNYYIPQEMSKF